MEPGAGGGAGPKSSSSSEEEDEVSSSFMGLMGGRVEGSAGGSVGPTVLRFGAVVFSSGDELRERFRGEGGESPACLRFLEGSDGEAESIVGTFGRYGGLRSWRKKLLM